MMKLLASLMPPRSVHRAPFTVDVKVVVPTSWVAFET